MQLRKLHGAWCLQGCTALISPRTTFKTLRWVCGSQANYQMIPGVRQPVRTFPRNAGRNQAEEAQQAAEITVQAVQEWEGGGRHC